LGAEIMASIGALVGHDETGSYREATHLGILPDDLRYKVVFMALIPRDQPLQVSCSISKILILTANGVSS
jgi:hypothetical protein